MKYNGVELYEKNGKVALLVSYGYGAGWSTWGDERLAYDKRVVEFWLAHKDDEYYMRKVRDYSYTGHEASFANMEATAFFDGIGYKDTYLGGFEGIEIEWVEPNDVWRISEYDGSEHIEKLNDAGFVCFAKEDA